MYSVYSITISDTTAPPCPINRDRDTRDEPRRNSPSESDFPLWRQATSGQHVEHRAWTVVFYLSPARGTKAVCPAVWLAHEELEQAACLADDVDEGEVHRNLWLPNCPGTSQEGEMQTEENESAMDHWDLSTRVHSIRIETRQTYSRGSCPSPAGQAPSARERGWRRWPSACRARSWDRRGSALLRSP